MNMRKEDLLKEEKDLFMMCRSFNSFMSGNVDLDINDIDIDSISISKNRGKRDNKYAETDDDTEITSLTERIRSPSTIDSSIAESNTSNILPSTLYNNYMEKKASYERYNKILQSYGCNKSNNDRNTIKIQQNLSKGAKNNQDRVFAYCLQEIEKLYLNNIDSKQIRIRVEKWLEKVSQYLNLPLLK